MSKALRKLRRTKKPGIVKRILPPILIVRPHKQEGFTCQSTSQFILKSELSGVAASFQIESKVPEVARNRAIYEFLQNFKFKECTHIFFLDDDSTPIKDDAIATLWRHNKPFVAAVTPIYRSVEGIDFSKLELISKGVLQNEKIKVDCHWNVFVQKKDKHGVLKQDHIGINELPGKPFKAYKTGGTGLLVRRDVLEKIKPPYQITTYNKSYTDVKLSEDVYFSNKIREAGFELWVDPSVQCHHYHTVDIFELFSIAEQARRRGYDEAKRDYKILK